MKNLKKLAALLLVLTMLFSFVGCGAADDKKLVMATNANFPPYEYKDGDSYAGIDVEIAGLIAEKLGLELEIADIEFGAIISGVQTGKYDMGMAGMTVTDERLEQVSFSDTYANAVQSVIVKSDSEYTSFEDFYTGFDKKGNPAGVKDGIVIAVQQDTTGHIYASDEPKNYGFGEKNVISYKNGADAVEALKAGKANAVIIDNEPAKAFVAANTGLKILEGSYAEEDYAICVAKENKDLLEKINKALKELKAEGKIDEIVDKYIK